MNRIEKETLERWLLLWGLGNFLMFLFLFPALVLGFSGIAGIRIREFRWAKISHRLHPEGLVAYYRHVSLADGLTLALSHWPRWLFGEKFLPLSFIADYWLEWVPFLGHACISLPKDESTKKTRREAVREAVAVISEAAGLLEKGRILYMAPPGSREKNCRHFKVRHGGKILTRETSMFLSYQSLRQACDDKLIAAFQHAGIGRLAQRTNAKFLPISFRRGRGWKKWFLEIKYGSVLEVPADIRRNRETVVAYLEDELLALVEKP